MSESASSQRVRSARVPPLTIVLLVVLALGIAALAFDGSARWRANQAYGKIDAMINEEDVGQQDLSDAGPRTPTEIHKVIGREPDATEQGKDDLRETYSWRGVFKTYSVHLVYSGATLDLENPDISEPLLTKVGFMGPPQ
jgi:hypothetical protein